MFRGCFNIQLQEKGSQWGRIFSPVQDIGQSWRQTTVMFHGQKNLPPLPPTPPPTDTHTLTHKRDPQIVLLMYKCGRVTIRDEFVTLWLPLFLASAKTNPAKSTLCIRFCWKIPSFRPSTGRLPLCFFFLLFFVFLLLPSTMSVPDMLRSTVPLVALFRLPAIQSKTCQHRGLQRPVEHSWLTEIERKNRRKRMGVETKRNI